MSFDRPRDAGGAASSPSNASGTPGKSTQVGGILGSPGGGHPAAATPGKQSRAQSDGASSAADHASGARATSAWGIVADPHTVRFPATELGAVSPASTIAVRNPTEATTNIASLDIVLYGGTGEAALPDEFQLVQGNPGQLHPRASIDIALLFQPKRVAQHIGARLRVRGRDAHQHIDVSLKATAIPPRSGNAAQCELSVAQHAGDQLESGGTPSVRSYGEMLAAVLAARSITDRATPVDTETRSQISKLLEPVAKRLNQINDHQGRLAQFGAGNVAGQTSLDMSEAAVRAWLQLLALGAKIRTDELVMQFRAGAEVIRFLTGEQSDAPTLRAFDRASRTVEIGAAALTLGAPLVALAAEAAAPLALAARLATQRVVTWALVNPAAALAASEALLGFGIQIGEDGWESFWDQLRDPQGRWFVIIQVFMDYMHVKGSMSGHGRAPGRSGKPGAGLEPDVARQRATRVRTIVQQVHDAATTADTTSQGPAVRRSAGPVAGRDEGRGRASVDPATIQDWATEQTRQVQALLERPIPPAAKADLASRWQRIEDGVARLRTTTLSANQVAVSRIKSEMEQMRQAVSTTIQGGGAGNQAATAQRNWRQADDLVRGWARSREPITLDRIKELNRILDAGLGHNGGAPGELRTRDVSAGGSVAKMYMADKDISAQMASFVEWYRANEGAMPPIELAARAYQRLVSIHPFLDANGRTCRLVMDWIVQRHDLPPPVLAAGEQNVAVFWSDAYNGGGVTVEQATRAVTAGIERALAMLGQASQQGAHP